MMEMTRDSSDPFGGLSTQHESVNSSPLARIGLNVLGGHIQFSSYRYHHGKFAMTSCLQNCLVGGDICCNADSLDISVNIRLIIKKNYFPAICISYFTFFVV